MKLTLFSSICAAYFFLHSFLADEGIKGKLNRLFPGEEKYHRLLYNLISFLGLGILLWNIFSPGFSPVVELPFRLRVLGGMGLLGGTVLLYFSFRNYDPAEFLGTDRLKPGAKEIHGEVKLNLSGLNAYVRHPIYLSVVVLSISFMAAYPTRHVWAFCLVVFIYLPVGIWLEERKLIGYFGDAYREYRKKVPAVFPF
jgi:protein-S-isoprenylcysteine O-methyltransferase Ste14